MSRARVTRMDWNEAAADEIASWPSTVDRMVVVGNAVAEAVIRNTPERRGKLKGGVTVDAGGVDAQGAVCIVGSNYGGAVPAEVGSVNNAPYGMYQKGVRESGLRLAGD